MSNIVFENIEKTYKGNIKAVCDFNFEIKDNEFVILVGPSGCGKSTTLRMIAGLEDITSGKLYIGETLVNNISPKDRDIAMVFQNYALYPYMTVYQNMAFGLKMRKTPKNEIETKIMKVAESLDITQLLKRKPKELSGGQRQRVALGRAIVREPSVFLFDEPLSNLDAKLRTQMRSEITNLHRRLKTTFVYVTHDQTEAMTMADRILVMKDGYIKQADTPKNLYDRPNSLFVAEFIGSPQMNKIKGVIKEVDGNLFVFCFEYAFMLSKNQKNHIRGLGYINKEVWLGIRPEHIKKSEYGKKNCIEAVVEFVEMTGSEAYLHIRFKDVAMIAKVDIDIECKVNDLIYMEFDSEKIYLFDAETEMSIC